MLHKMLSATLVLLAVLATVSITPATAQTRPRSLMWDCFKDSGFLSSVLQYEDIATSLLMQRNKTARQAPPCIQACSAKGFEFAGIRNNTQCWCGMNVTADTRQAVKCLYCPGDSRYRCGSTNQIAVYQTPRVPPPPFKYVRCLLYKTKAERSMMKGVMREYSYMSYRATNYRQMTSCVQACSARGYRYAGITYKFWCHCGNTLRKNRNGACPKCQGDRRQYCGSESTMSIYEIRNVFPRASVCGGNNKSVAVNGSISLHCDSPGSNIEFSWEKVDRFGRTVPLDRFRMHLSPSGRTLVIQNASYSDAGKFQCRARNDHIVDARQRSSIAIANLQVIKPVMISMRQDRAAIDNQQAKLTCEVIGAGPLSPFSVQWLFNGRPLGPFSSQLPASHQIHVNPAVHNNNQQFNNQRGVPQPGSRVNTKSRTNTNLRNIQARNRAILNSRKTQQAKLLQSRKAQQAKLRNTQQARLRNAQQARLRNAQQARYNTNNRNVQQPAYQNNMNVQQPYGNTQNNMNMQQPYGNMQNNRNMRPNTGRTGYTNARNNAMMPRGAQMLGQTNDYTFMQQGNAHVLVLRRIQFRHFGNYTCRVFNPAATTDDLRVLQHEFSLRRRGQPLHSIPTQFPYTSYSRGQTCQLKNGPGIFKDGALVVAVLMSVINAFLLLVLVFVGYRWMKSNSDSGDKQPKNLNTQDSDWTMPGSPKGGGKSSKSYRLYFGGANPGAEQTPPNEDSLDPAARTGSDAPSTGF
eukprot:scpid77281/ scgid29719/ Putative fungistatic metabolite